MLSDDERGLSELAIQFMISGLEDQNRKLKLKIDSKRLERANIALDLKAIEDEKRRLRGKGKLLDMDISSLTNGYKNTQDKIEELRKLRSTFKWKVQVPPAAPPPPPPAVRVVYKSKKVLIPQGDALCHHLRTLVRSNVPLDKDEIITISSRTYPGIMREKSQSEAQIGILRDHGLANDPQAGLWVAMPWGVDFDSIDPIGLVRCTKQGIPCLRFYAGGYMFTLPREVFRGGSWVWQPHHPHIWVVPNNRTVAQQHQPTTNFAKQLFGLAQSAEQRIGSSKTLQRDGVLLLPPPAEPQLPGKKGKT